MNMLNLFQVPEPTIILASEKATGPEKESYLKILLIGQQWKDAELTPLYLFDKDKDKMHVFAQELIGKKLH